MLEILFAIQYKYYYFCMDYIYYFIKRRALNRFYTRKVVDVAHDTWLQTYWLESWAYPFNWENPLPLKNFHSHPMNETTRVNISELLEKDNF